MSKTPRALLLATYHTLRLHNVLRGSVHDVRLWVVLASCSGEEEQCGTLGCKLTFFDVDHKSIKNFSNVHELLYLHAVLILILVILVSVTVY